MERKLATIIFADLVGSTALADEQDPERVRVRLDRFYEAMAAEIEAAGGTVEKFAGDAVMAAFGAPAAHEDHAERALHASLAMQRRLRETFGDRLALRIGVNTGDVVVDRPREGSSFVTGDAVNVAARLEQAAAPGEILVGNRTADAARGAFEFGKTGTVEAKGKPRGVECRRLLRALSLMRPRGVAGLEQAFIGRDGELALLQREYAEAVQTRAPRLVTVLGDGGVGKSRLVRELWQRLSAASPEPVRRTGRCLSYGEGITYWPLGEILKEHFGLLDSDPPELVLDRFGDWQILGLTLGLDVAGDLHPLAARDRFQDSWVAFLEEIASERPVVVLVEDIHWSEEPLLDLLERLVRDVRAPLLLVATARPELIEGHPGWGARLAGATCELEALTADDSRRMLSELLAGALPEGLQGVVVEQAEGNPFFVEELLATLIDRRLLRRANGGWSLDELPDDFAVPDSVRAVVAARIDLLEPDEKQALQAAAVVGRIFWTGPVYELIESAEPDFDVLESRDFIRRRMGSSLAGEREYAIKHALTREVAYDSLPKARRAQMHAAFAAWLKRTGEGRDEHAPLLAHHYAEAVRPEDADLAWADDESELLRLREQAVTWLRRAGELALRRYELDDAVSLLNRALELEHDEALRSELWRAIGRAKALRFDGEGFWTAMQESLTVCTDSAVCAETYAELAFQTAIRSGMWTRRPDSSLVEGWIDSALELAGPTAPSRVKALLARCFWGRETPHAIEAGALAERVGDIELRSYAWQARAHAAFSLAQFDESLTWAQRPLDIADEISDPDHVADIYETAIHSSCSTGRIAEARRLVAKHDAVVESLSAHHRLHGIAVRLEVEEVAGAWEAILELAPQTEAIVEANLSTPCIRNARSLLVTALAAAHHADDDAVDYFERRANELPSEGYDYVLAVPRIHLAILRRRLDELEPLLSLLGEHRQGHVWLGLPSRAAYLDGLTALGRREELEAEAPPLTRRRSYLEPFALRALGVVRKDQTLLAQAVERFEAMHLDWHASETRRLIAQA